MNENSTIFFHALYVGFAFSVLFFGALAFRQIMDAAEVRELQMGEDRDSFIDGAAAAVLVLSFLLVSIIGFLCYMMAPPSIYMYALPLVLAVQVFQLGLRMVFQRTLVKTKGLVVQAVLLHKHQIVLFHEILAIRLKSSGLWVTVRIALPNNEVVFRIFSVSAPSFQHLMSTACRAPVLWLKNDVDERQKNYPINP